MRPTGFKERFPLNLPTQQYQVAGFMARMRHIQFRL